MSRETGSTLLGTICPADVPLRLHSPPKPINTCSLDKKKHHVASESTIRSNFEIREIKNFEIREIRVCISRETGSTLLGTMPG